LPEVHESLVVAHEDEVAGKQLVAYLTTKAEITPAQLKAGLQRTLPDYMVPAHFMLLDAFPLSPNGKVDRKALPKPGAQRKVHVAPSTQNEIKLARLWSEVLRIESPGTDEDFFALGGHSLLAIKLFHRIEQEFEVRLPLATIFSAPTIAGLAAAIAAGAGDGALLVPLKPSATGTPLFCIHPVGGQVFFYQKLAQRLGETGPVYGIQSHEVAGLSGRPGDARAMATAYARLIRERQPYGPYRLLGWSSGGVLALLVTAELEAQGCEVEYVGLLDTVPMLEKDETDEQHLLGFATMSMLASLRGRAFSSEQLDEMQASLKQQGMRVSDLFLEAHRAFALAFMERWGETVITPDILRRITDQNDAIRRHLDLLAGVMPQPVQAPLQICWAEVHSVAPVARHAFEGACVNDADNGREYPGDHYGILEEPHVAAIAQGVASFIASRNAVTCQR
ncbi:MAG: thioesterase domain-containing protein, partial [Telluria sp.]